MKDTLRVKFDYSLTHGDHFATWQTVEIKRTTQATMGGWSHATWVCPEGKSRKRVASYTLEQDEEALRSYYFGGHGYSAAGPLPEMVRVGRGLYLVNSANA